MNILTVVCRRHLSSSRLSCQHLLDMVDQWLQWSGMRAKVCKCHSLAIQSCTGKLVNPELKLAGEPILFIGSRSIKFLGMRIQVPYDVTACLPSSNIQVGYTNCNGVYTMIFTTGMDHHIRFYSEGIARFTLCMGQFALTENAIKRGRHSLPT